MGATPRSQVDHDLADSIAGDQWATDRLLEAAYDQLRALAAHHIQGERPDHTLQPTALVHEAYLRLAHHDQIDWQGRTHFLALAATTMRRLLVNHARDRRAKKRGAGAARVTLSTAPLEDSTQTFEILDLEQAMEALGENNPRRARVVELRFFGGLSVEETAHTLDVSERTVKDDWRFARAWMRRTLRCEDEGS